MAHYLLISARLLTGSNSSGLAQCLTECFPDRPARLTARLAGLLEGSPSGLLAASGSGQPGSGALCWLLTTWGDWRRSPAGPALNHAATSSGPPAHLNERCLSAWEALPQMCYYFGG